jgi:GNAT superfamily N-acetyltransferase
MSPIQPLRADKLTQALQYVLAMPASEQLADARAVRGFAQYVQQSPIRWIGWESRRRDALTGLLLAVLLPGSTAIVMIPTPGELGIEPDAQSRVTAEALARLATNRLHFAQALLLPEAVGQRRVLTQLGFQPLAPLLYLERDVRYPWVDAPALPGADWLPFSDETRGAFVETLQATYEDSLDCPELTGLRPMDDIITAHQASGRFDPAWWELLRVDGRNAACLLLTQLPHAPMVEVVYMGVVPSHRRRGLGSVLLQRALARCRAAAKQRLTLVVDERNGPARRLYDSFALRPVARREAFLYRWTC